MNQHYAFFSRIRPNSKWVFIAKNGDIKKAIASVQALNKKHGFTKYKVLDTSVYPAIEYK